MDTRERLADRARKARAAVAFATVVARGRDGQPETLLIPGKGAQHYQVTMHREPGALYTHCERRFNPDPTWDGEVKCWGNHVTVCYHSMQAVEVALAEQHRIGRWCADLESATFQAKMLNGNVVTVKSANNVEATALYLAVGG